MNAALSVLEKTFGYAAFRGQQDEIIRTVIDGGDALVLMPTGGGKSLCYQIPALVRAGTGVVISPLIALMQDQVDALSAVGARAAFLNSTQSADERRSVETAFINGELDLLYLAPERLRVASTIDLLDRGAIALQSREQQWDGIEAEDFAPLPLMRRTLDPFDTETANRELLSHGCVYSAGYGRFHKPIFFLGRLLRVEERAGFMIVVSSCEYARELAAPPAMLQGKTIFVRLESVRRYLWEKIEEWRWRKQGNAMARALASYDFVTDTEVALQRMADNETETMILHEIGEAIAGELLGEAWQEMVVSVARTRAEVVVRAVRDLLADCLSTLPELLARTDMAALHFYFATFDAPRHQLFPQALEAYEDFLRCGRLDALEHVVRAGKERWLAEARGLLVLDLAANSFFKPD